MATEMLRMHRSRAQRMAGPGGLSAWLIRRCLLHVTVVAPGLALGHASGFGQSAGRSPELYLQQVHESVLPDAVSNFGGYRTDDARNRIARFTALPEPAFEHAADHLPQPLPQARPPFHRDKRLCLEQVHEGALPNFEPVGLATTETVGLDPAITMWSRTEVLALRLSPSGETVKSFIRRAIPDTDPLSASLTRWDDEGVVIEALDAHRGHLRIINMATGDVGEGSGTLPGVASASAALRQVSGWVQAHKLERADADTMAITVFGVQSDGPPAVYDQVAPEPSGRRIDRLLHMRPDNLGGVLVQEGGFPFATIAFDKSRAETWRALPDPADIRDLLRESDLRYVVATPAIALDDAVLNTFVAVRSGVRIATIRRRDRTVRYREIPGSLAFLGSFPAHQLLVGTRSGQPYELVIFQWRWIDRREPCANTPLKGRL